MMFELDPGAMPAGYGESIVPLAAAKAHCRVVEDDDDLLIEALRDAAVDLVEKYTGKFLARRTGVVWTGAGFGPRMLLGMGPKVEVTAVEYDGPSGAVVLTGADYRFAQGRILPAFGSSWPGDCRGAVRVTFDAGFEDVAAEAPALISAVKLMIANLYDNREAVVTGTIATEIPLGFRMICDLHRVPVL